MFFNIIDNYLNNGLFIIILACDVLFLLKL